MPVYYFEHKDYEGPENVYKVECSSDEIQQLEIDLKEDGYNRIYSVNLVSQSGSNLSKTDNGWKDVLRRMKSNSGRKNTINV